MASNRGNGDAISHYALPANHRLRALIRLQDLRSAHLHPDTVLDMWTTTLSWRPAAVP
jgi:hypothetical protein